MGAGFPFFKGINGIIQPESTLYIEWQPTGSPKVDSYFKEAANPFQSWQYLFRFDQGDLIYGLSLNVLPARSALDQNLILLVAEHPRPELYKLSTNTDNNFLENSEGNLIQSNLDSRIISSALRNFESADTLEVLLYAVAAIPEKTIVVNKVIPRYIKDENLPQDASIRITTGPIESIYQEDGRFSAQNTGSILKANQPFNYALKVTQKDGSWQYYSAAVIAENGPVNA